jgi:transcriptional regulator with XRE-family HTH domain
VLNVARLAQALGVSASDLLSPGEEQRGDLRAVRLSLGLSVGQVADRAGMPRSSYLRWEHGDFVHIPPMAALERLASVLGVPVVRLSQVMEQTRKVDPSQ